MTLRPSIAIVIATAVAGAAMASCGNDEPARSNTESTSSQARPTTLADGEATTSTSSSVPVTTTPTLVAPTTVMTTASRPVFDFAAASTADGWSVINDTVMGGVSSGELAWTDGVLVFTGELSLDNNGGFASIRSPDIDAERASEWASGPGPRIQVESDGRTWTLQLRTNDDSGGWISSFSTSAQGRTDLELPWASFKPVTRFLELRATDEPLNPARIVSLAFYLVDGIEGPFRLGIHSVS